MAIESTGMNGRKAYHAPRLSVLGDVGSLTESGSGNGNEGMVGVGGCTNNQQLMGPMC